MIEFSFLFIILILFLQWRLHSSRGVSQLLATSLTIYLLFWNIFPFLYSYFMPTRTDNVIFSTVYQKIVFVQFLSLILILSMLNFLTRLKFNIQSNAPCKVEAIHPRVVVFLLVIALITLLFIKNFFIQKIGFTFIERAEYTLSNDNKEGGLVALFGVLNSYIVPFAFACIFLYARQNYNVWITRLAFVIVSVHIGYSFVFGTRSVLFLPIILMILYWKEGFLSLKIPQKVAIFFLTLFLVFMAPFLSLNLRSVRSLQSYSPSDVASINPFAGGSSWESIPLDILDDIYMKFSSFQYGTALLQVEGEERVGCSLIISSIMSPIPRFLYPLKPVPFSSNGEYSGAPYYVVANILNPSFRGYIVPVPASTIALWELGFVGLGLMILFNIINLFLANNCLKSSSLMYKSIGFFMLAMPTFEFLIAPTGWIIKEGLRIVLVVVFVRIFFVIISRFRKSFVLK